MSAAETARCRPVVAAIVSRGSPAFTHVLSKDAARSSLQQQLYSDATPPSSRPHRSQFRYPKFTAAQHMQKCHQYAQAFSVQEPIC